MSGLRRARHLYRCLHRSGGGGSTFLLPSIPLFHYYELCTVPPFFFLRGGAVRVPLPLPSAFLPGRRLGQEGEKWGGWRQGGRRRGSDRGEAGVGLALRQCREKNSPGLEQKRRSASEVDPSEGCRRSHGDSRSGGCNAHESEPMTPLLLFDMPPS